MEIADTMWAKRLMWVVWPAFLVAGVLEMLVFAMVDPQDLHWAGQPLELSRQGIYTVAFFVFWPGAGLTAGAAGCRSQADPSARRQESSGIGSSCRPVD